MIMIPYPVSKKEMQKMNKEFLDFLPIFGKTLLFSDIIVIFLVSILISIFVVELRPASLLEFFGLLVGMQFQLIIPIAILSIVTSSILYKNSKNNLKPRK